MAKFNTINTETSLFAEALRAVLEAEERTLAAFSETYGDSIPRDGGNTPGEAMFRRSGLYAVFSRAKNELRRQIGECVERSLEEAGTAAKEGVC